MPEAVITHFEGVTAGTDTSSGMKRYQEINKEKFLEKWKEVLERDHLPNANDIFLARDRRNGPRALVIDHQVPSYDRDSGSLRMYEILKFLVEFGSIASHVPTGTVLLTTTTASALSVSPIDEAASNTSSSFAAPPWLDGVPTQMKTRSWSLTSMLPAKERRPEAAPRRRSSGSVGS